MTEIRVGVLVNPIAGFGGALALHGTDDLPAARYAEAISAGRAAGRLIRAVKELLHRSGNVTIVAAPGLLGSDQLAAAGIEHHLLPSADAPASGAVTTSADTARASAAFAAAGISALLFAGGDGTATIVADEFGTRVPCVGVPAGVKMHSAVFARSPERAGRLLAEHLSGSGTTTIVDVLDAGAKQRTERVGVLLAPRVSEPLQGAKSSSPATGHAHVSAALHELLDGAAAGTTWVIGPGTTTAAFAEQMGITPTLGGVDVSHPDGTVEHDVDEVRLFEIVQAAALPQLVVGVVGGQGFLFGRGNHELSVRVLESIGASRVHIFAAADKIGGLQPPILLIDVDPPSGCGPVPHPLAGYRSVRTGPNQSMVMRVVDAASHP